MAVAVSLSFAAVLAGYFVLTSAYSLHLKRKMMLDVIVLAILYAVRVVGGAVAVDVTPSERLLAFAMFVFTALALMKRHVELSLRLERGLPDPSNRDYRIGDLTIVGALAAAAALNAVTIYTLYISSAKVAVLYSRPVLLWAVCPLLLYWRGRALILTHRRQMDDDPIVFALKDRVSWAVAGLALLCVIAAI